MIELLIIWLAVCPITGHDIYIKETYSNYNDYTSFEPFFYLSYSDPMESYSTVIDEEHGLFLRAKPVYAKTIIEKDWVPTGDGVTFTAEKEEKEYGIRPLDKLIEVKS